jgi:predicted permease
LLTEALALAALGGAAGVLLATWLMALLPSRLGLTATLPGLDVRLDGRVLGFGLGLSLLTGALFGVAPALQASAGGAARAGHHSDASSGADRTPRLRALLVSVQVALSLVLLVGAGLMLRTLGNLASVPLGFETAGVRVAQVDVSEPGMPWQGLAPVTEDELGAARLDVYGRILDQIRQLPGAEAASLALVSPFSSMRMANDVLWEAPDSTASLGRTNVDMNVVGDDWFRTMKVPLVLGRPFTDQDRGGAPDVAIVNEALAARLWPGESAVGKRLWSWRPDGPDQPLDVVGVAANGRYYRSWQTADRPFVFLPLAQNPMASMTLHVRGVTPAVPTAESIRAAVLEVAPDVPAPRVHLLSDARAETIGLQRSTARLLGLFGALALTIAAIGIYGVVSFSVSRRTREIGLRVALGARPLDVRRFVIVGGALPVVVGTALGCVIALGLGRFAVGLLYGVGPRDPLTFGSVAALLVGIGLLASYLPARRATRVSPLEALRH